MDFEVQTRAERSAAFLLIAAALLAMTLANSALADAWHQLLDQPLGPRLPHIGELTPHVLVADGLMAIFFLHVGLEVKREWIEGQLSTPDQRRLPVIAAAAGMAVPALIYLGVAGGAPGLARGWAIPSATDIAFVIGLLALLGRRVPPSIRLLLVTIAIVDDIGAVAIIALAYTAELDFAALAAVVAVVAAMLAMGRLGVRRPWPFLAGFALLWLLVLASGIHPTIAGILAATAIPLAPGEPVSPLRTLEHRLHPWVIFGIVPLFGLVSAGVAPSGETGLASRAALAVAAGLFLGKQIGIFGAIYLADRTGVARRPDGAGWAQLHGASLLCGIGFTMSLFIGALAFPGHPELADQAKLGTLAGSLLSAAAGYAVLRLARPGPAQRLGRNGAAGYDQADSATTPKEDRHGQGPSQEE